MNKTLIKELHDRLVELDEVKNIRHNAPKTEDANALNKYADGVESQLEPKIQEIIDSLSEQISVLLIVVLPGYIPSQEWRVEMFCLIGNKQRHVISIGINEQNIIFSDNQI